jgi:hypothetical protein
MINCQSTISIPTRIVTRGVSGQMVKVADLKPLALTTLGPNPAPDVESIQLPNIMLVILLSVHV